MAYALRDVDTFFVLSETNFNRRVAAIREVKAVQPPTTPEPSPWTCC